MNPPRILITEDGLMMEKNRIQLRINIDAAKASNLTISSEVLRAADVYVFSAMVAMARCAVPARVVAGGTNVRATLAIEGVAPLHAARTSQRDVPTTLNTYDASALRSEKKAAINAGAQLTCRHARKGISGKRAVKFRFARHFGEHFTEYS